MGLPQLETCCFVFDLKTGNIILGCVNAVFSFAMTVTMIVVSATVGVVEQEAVALDATSSEVDIETQAALTGLYAMSIILVFMFLAKFFFDVFFIYGVIAERAGIIKAYFIMWTVFFLLSLFTFFLNAPNYSAGVICSEIFYIGLNIYSILISNSFYRQLNNREEL